MSKMPKNQNKQKTPINHKDPEKPKQAKNSKKSETPKLQK